MKAIKARSMSVPEYLDYQDKMDELQAKVESKEISTRKFISQMALWVAENIYGLKPLEDKSILPRDMFNLAQKTVALSESAEDEAVKN